MTYHRLSLIFILVNFVSSTSYSVNQAVMFKNISCFASAGGELIKLEESKDSQKGFRILQSKKIYEYFVEVYLVAYQSLVEASLTLHGPDYLKYEAKGYLMPGPFDGVNLSALGFYVSCIYERP